jgi:processive 1,2-diacylglycerol beta-glucosyltransferase
VTTRNVLILSGRFGKGHDTVADATAVALAPLDVECRIVDAIALLGRSGAVAGERIFRAMLSSAPFYDALHFSQLRTGGRLARWMDRRAAAAMEPRLAAEAARFPPDLIVSVFATGAAAAAQYKADHPQVVTAVFITDTYAHRLWVHDGTDLFLTTSAIGARAVQAFRPRARVAVVTHPTRPAFYAPPSRAAARAALGLPSDGRCVLMMSGAWGIGPLAECAAALAQADITVLAVAGSNRRLARQLAELAERDPRVVPFGFTDRVAELMAASDAVITSSGDTCREARVIGRPLVLIDVVPGHGRENLMHELELGGAVVAMPEPRVLVDAVSALLDGPHELAPVTSPAQWEQELRAALATVGFS